MGVLVYTVFLKVDPIRLAPNICQWHASKTTQNGAAGDMLITQFSDWVTSQFLTTAVSVVSALIELSHNCSSGFQP